MMKTLFAILSVLLFLKASGQERITFKASDSLTVYANLYETDKTQPYIILFHQAGFSKGEYKESAAKLTKLGYNCLAVDLRSGDGVNFIQNETAKEAKSKNLPTEYINSEPDMKAAIDWAYSKSQQPVILFGSSYSASLALKLAKANPRVKAVIAFSPGEYFKPGLVIKDQLKGFDKPCFVACSQREYTYMSDLLLNIPDKLKTVFKPKEGTGEHGSKALWSTCPTSNEYWLALFIFFKTI